MWAGLWMIQNIPNDFLYKYINFILKPRGRPVFMEKIRGCPMSEGPMLGSKAHLCDFWNIVSKCLLNATR
jgi:hypothetical protein